MLVLTVVSLIMVLLVLISSFSGLYFHRIDKLASEKFDEVGFRNSNLKVRQDFHYSKYVFSGTESFINLFNDDHEKIKSIPLNDKCMAFFKNFEHNNPDWEFDKYDSKGMQYDKDIDKKQRFFEENQKRLLSQRKQDGEPNADVITHEDNKTINVIFKSQVEKTTIIDQGMADTITMMRLYGKCFLNNPDVKETELYNLFTSKLFPYLHNTIPIFETSNSTDPLPEDSWPIYNEINDDYDVVHNAFNSSTDNFIDFIKKNSKGRGIVISATTRHSRDVVKLVRVLRALNNKLPIQIIHKGDINKRSMEFLDIAALADIDFLLSPSISAEHRDFLPELNMLEQYRSFGSEFPKQNIMYVNVANCINRSFKYSFPGYSNKLLALMFTSFEEVMLLDADTVLLMGAEKFFEAPEYKKSGAFFFKDRTLRDYNDFLESNFFTKLMPANENSIETLFDIPLVTEKTLSNKFLTGWRHSQEAGVIVINKVDHLLGLLMTFPLCLWKEPVKSSIWGDKEMYWLGMSMAGDELYEFNKYAAASVGEVTTNPKNKHYSNSKANEICSSHPGHVSSDGKLMWINSGFSFCKKNGYYRDRVKFPFNQYDNKDLAVMFLNPLKVRAALVPPDLPEMRAIGSPIDDTPEKEFKDLWKLRRKDSDEINVNMKDGQSRVDVITDWDPQKGWVKSSVCFGYHYCAYDLVESYNQPDDGSIAYDRGVLFEFDDETSRKYDFLSKVWHTGNSRTRPEGWVYAKMEIRKQ